MTMWPQIREWPHHFCAKSAQKKDPATDFATPPQSRNKRGNSCRHLIFQTRPPPFPSPPLFMPLSRQKNPLCSSIGAGSVILPPSYDFLTRGGEKGRGNIVSLKAQTAGKKYRRAHLSTHEGTPPPPPYIENNWEEEEERALLSFPSIRYLTIASGHASGRGERARGRNRPIPSMYSFHSFP